MKLHQNVFFAVIIAGLIICSCTPTEKGSAPASVNYPVEYTLSKADLMDKIKGGWAGQVIGCTYGGPTEFQYNGTMIQDYIPIEWDGVHAVACQPGCQI
jgi:hypothetical protein